jgi:type IV secretion system protein VirB2
VAKAVGIIAIVVTALGFAFSEGGSALRKGIGIVFGLAVAFTSTTFISSLFSITSGAVF